MTSLLINLDTKETKCACCCIIESKNDGSHKCSDYMLRGTYFFLLKKQKTRSQSHTGHVPQLMCSYQLFSIDLNWKARLSLGLLCQSFHLSAHGLRAVWGPLRV